MEFLKKEIENYLKEIQNTKSFTTYKTYKTILLNAIDFVEVEQNTINITKYRIQIASQERKTIAKKVSVLRSFFKNLENKGYNFRIIGDEQVSVPKTLPKPIPLAKIQEALEKADLREWTVVSVIFGLGLRIGEAVDIEIKNISKNWVTITGKGNKTRTIPIEKKLKKGIDKYIQMFKPTKYLFEKNKKQLTQAQIRYIITKTFQKVGIKVTPHQLRHSFATYLLNNGARINDVSELLGHKFISTTQIYTKLNDNMKYENYKKAHPLCQS